MPPTNEAHHAHHRKTAAAHMFSNVPRAHPVTPVAEVIEALRGHLYECADTVFVKGNAGQLVCVARTDALCGKPAERIGDITEEETEAVLPGDDQEDISRLAIRLKIIPVPVVDKQGQLVGAVPPEALFRILRDEHMEDLQWLARTATYGSGADAAFDALLLNRLVRRLPWLVFDLLASSIITKILVEFEHTISRNVAAAFFVPAPVCIAGGSERGQSPFRFAVSHAAKSLQLSS